MCVLPSWWSLCDLDGPTIRNANPGNSRELIRGKNPIFIMFERFARIALNLRFAILVPPNAIRKRGVQIGNPRAADSREAANRFARIGPSNFCVIHRHRSPPSQCWTSNRGQTGSQASRHVIANAAQWSSSMLSRSRWKTLMLSRSLHDDLGMKILSRIWRDWPEGIAGEVPESSESSAWSSSILGSTGHQYNLATFDLQAVEPP